MAALTVRFHGLVFCLARRKLFVAIDYASPRGKVSSTAAYSGLADRVIGIDDIDPERLADRIDEMLSPGGAVLSIPAERKLDQGRTIRVGLLRDAVS